MTMKIMLDEKAYMPVRAHEWDAGLDLKSPGRVVIRPDSSAVIDTGVHVQIPQGYVGMLKSKSGLNVKYDLTNEGVIDCGYTGSIIVKLYNHGKSIMIIEKGDKISQLVILPIEIPRLEVVDWLEETERGDRGFGSTGR